MLSEEMRRKTDETHPQLSFQLDLRALDAEVWTSLGRVQAGFNMLHGIALKPTVSQSLQRVFLARGVRATTAIEGNTLTEKEVLAEVDGRLRLPPSKEYLAQEVRNVIDALNGVTEQAALGAELEITPELLRSWNARLLAGDVPAAEEAVPGQFREHRVHVGPYRAPDPSLVAPLVDEMCRWLNVEFSARGRLATPVRVIRAVGAHLYLAWIHPFGDGNGRTARLCEVALLRAAGAPGPAAHLLSNFYAQTRSRYYAELDRASKSRDPSAFIAYAAHGLADALEEPVAAVKGHELDLAWESMYHEQLDRDAAGATRHRRKLLIEAISSRPDGVSRAEVGLLTPPLAREYALRTSKTLARDLTALSGHGLIRRSGGRIWANMDIMRAFMT